MQLLVNSRFDEFHASSSILPSRSIRYTNTKNFHP